VERVDLGAVKDATRAELTDFAVAAALNAHHLLGDAEMWPGREAAGAGTPSPS
jgi:hypothetical protein